MLNYVMQITSKTRKKRAEFQMSEVKTLNMGNRNIEKPKRDDVRKGRERLVLGEQHRLNTKIEGGSETDRH